MHTNSWIYIIIRQISPTCVDARWTILITSRHTQKDTEAAEQQDKLSSQSHHTTDPNTFGAEKEHTLPQQLAIK